MNGAPTQRKTGLRRPPANRPLQLRQRPRLRNLQAAAPAAGSSRAEGPGLPDRAPASPLGTATMGLGPVLCRGVPGTSVPPGRPPSGGRRPAPSLGAGRLATGDADSESAGWTPNSAFRVGIADSEADSESAVGRLDTESSFPSRTETQRRPGKLRLAVRPQLDTLRRKPAASAVGQQAWLCVGPSTRMAGAVGRGARIRC